MSKDESSVLPPSLVIEETNLSRAWAKLLLHIIDNPGKEIVPLALKVSGFAEDGTAAEDSALRQALDLLLKSMDRYSVEVVAFTIFPQRYWIMSRGDRMRLFELYRRACPRLKALNRRTNNRGLYFERMIMYGRGPGKEGNQLEWVLSQYENGVRHGRGVRRSMFQTGIFDPGRDHVPNARLNFPCLQQVSFVPTRAGLVTNAVYATQQIFDKAYGNYLGLARLGAFMAHEMGIPLACLNVHVGVAKFERIGKRDPCLAPLVTAARALVSQSATMLAHDASLRQRSRQQRSERDLTQELGKHPQVFSR